MWHLYKGFNNGPVLGIFCAALYCHALLQIWVPHTLPCTSSQQVCHYIQYISGQDICHQLQFLVSSKSIKMLGQLLCSHSLMMFYINTNHRLQQILQLQSPASLVPSLQTLDLLTLWLMLSPFTHVPSYSSCITFVYKPTIVYYRYSVQILIKLLLILCFNSGLVQLCPHTGLVPICLHLWNFYSKYQDMLQREA